MLQDDEYIEKILTSGSEMALFGLVKKYEVQVYNLCFRVLRNREQAEEIAQDAFLKSFKELNSLADWAKYGGWLMRITYRLAIDLVRKKRADLISLDEPALNMVEDRFFETPVDQLIGKDRVELIEFLLEKLSESDSAIISLFYLHGMGVKEVAEITELTESNVKIRLMRVRRFLKETLEKKHGMDAKDLY